ncbi:MAG: sigma-70 family RNA polymerase sigma factor [Candidatus Aminicenantes bacterium]|nr:sigma-70 family RNA polymerase sigma factor [Candidatus Aminicenantes bacterium]
MRQSEDLPESSLIKMAKSGNTEAYEILVKKYQKRIYFLCYRMTRAHQSADDLAQETFVKAYFNLTRFKEGLSFFTWIRKIAVNSALNYIKSKKREESLRDRESRVSENALPLYHESPHDKLQKSRTEQKFLESLDTLPFEQKTVFIMKFYENYSYDEIAQILNLPNGTVMSRLNRARKKIREYMSDYSVRSGR